MKHQEAEAQWQMQDVSAQQPAPLQVDLEVQDYQAGEEPFMSSI